LEFSLQPAPVTSKLKLELQPEAQRIAGRAGMAEGGPETLIFINPPASPLR
jgi:hypothetical protein